MTIDPHRLKKFLLDAELLTEKDFDEALKISQKNNKKIDDVLVEKKLIDKERLIKFEAYLSGIPFVNIEKEKIDPKVLNIIPEQVARTNNIAAFRKRGSDVEVAMLDPDDLATIDFIRKADPSLKILPRLTSPEAMKNALQQYQKNLETEFKNIVKTPSGKIGLIKESEPMGKEQDLSKAAEELPIVNIVEAILKHAILQKASDIHIEPQEKEVVVRFRIDGVLIDAMNLPIDSATGIVARIKVLSNLKLDEHRLPQDGRFKIESDDYKYSARVSVLPVFSGEKVVMRLLAEDEKTLSLEDLGFEGRALQIVKSNLKKPTGMILITGPTGSGKTTTLYAMMKILNIKDVNISTVEDPIEYRMPRINQTQVNAKIGLTFSAGLRSLVRQDPDIIMVGEIRDTETANLAINAALTGHLVLSTLHTTSSGGAMPRLTEMGAEPFLISSTVNVVIAQRLVRKFAGEKEKYNLKPEELKNLEKYCNLQKILQLLKEEKLAKPKDKMENVIFYRPKPSKEAVSGYKGRIGIFEVLTITDTIKDLIISKASTKEITAKAVEEGMRTMVEDGFVKAAKGLTSIEEVLRVIVD